MQVRWSVLGGVRVSGRLSMGDRWLHSAGEVVCPGGESGCQVDSAWVTGGCTVQVVCPGWSQGVSMGDRWLHSAGGLS